MRPRVLDLCCKAGGASAGFARLGWEVVGVDVEPQPRYPFAFNQGDILELPESYLRQFDLIWASPPCQAHTPAGRRRGSHRCIIGPTRALLQRSGRPYIIENVPGAPLRAPLTLCGSMFGLRVLRHRWFELSFELPSTIAIQEHVHRSSVLTGEYLSVVGNTGTFSWHYKKREELGLPRKMPGEGDMKTWSAAMGGLPWMKRHEITQAIPPDYSAWLGGAYMAWAAGER